MKDKNSEEKRKRNLVVCTLRCFSSIRVHLRLYSWGFIPDPEPHCHAHHTFSLTLLKFPTLRSYRATNMDDVSFSPPSPEILSTVSPPRPPRFSNRILLPVIASTVFAVHPYYYCISGTKLTYKTR